jgi:Winged helix DNA-binding domain
MDLAQRRLRNQYINGSPFEDAVEVVRALCAVQAQDYYASLWAVGLRLRGAHEADVERALNERRIVRTWPMRGTLHFIAAEDVRWLLALLAPRVLERQGTRLRRDFSIDRAVLRRARKIVEKAFCAGQAVTRSSLYERFDAGGVSTERQRGLHILWWLAHEGLICCGPRAGKQPTFVSLEEWVPPATAQSRRSAGETRAALLCTSRSGNARRLPLVVWPHCGRRQEVDRSRQVTTDRRDR